MAAVKAKKRGAMTQIANGLGITRQAVNRWAYKGNTIPAERVLDVERITGVDRRVLRPDLYDRFPVQTPRAA